MERKLISEGNTAEVFEWSNNKILKLFKSGFTEETCKKEFMINQELAKSLSNLPKAFEMIAIDDRPGIVYEKVSAPTLLELSLKKPWNIKKYGLKMAQIHFTIHQKEVLGEYIPNMITTLSTSISESIKLDVKEKERILYKLSLLPVQNRICHFDFHPDNIMYTKGKEKVIDWMTCCSGNPLADVARTSMMLELAVIPRVPAIINQLISIPQKIMNRAYLKEYCRLSKQTIPEIDEWRLVIMASRLQEWLPKQEADTLLKKVKLLLNDEAD
ncbi:aminoglycoside phosphotransferase family protein [Enterococcus sp. BWR-S5]|uniref:aminoglycoside phosphotransferase family protein n=1 Tax=Enterococcus sp. BWR-S5 TaxID=2787714 RepID=UPI00192348CC|nr:aminoglycoside phosphotransferase family protein [Enterococcus sp. BWR-S5]MBL1225864.1 phosphotransferase [Enterococcus sp. BWR-S5]